MMLLNSSTKFPRLLILLGILAVGLVILAWQNRVLFQPAPRSHNIVFNAVTKSASEYIAKTLIESLNYRRADIESIYNYNTKKFHTNINWFFKHKDMLSKQHIAAQEFELADGNQFPWVLDLKEYRKYSDRIVIHVRDPRQSVLSRVHHTNYYKKGGPFSLPLPADYFTMDLSQQIDWNIEHYLPSLVNWINGWIALKEKEDAKADGLKILFTTYDEFLADEQQFYHKILNFYAVPIDQFSFKEIKKDATVNYRKGDPNEWRQVMTTAQKQRMNEVVPPQLLNKFEWQL